MFFAVFLLSLSLVSVFLVVILFSVFDSHDMYQSKRQANPFFFSQRVVARYFLLFVVAAHRKAQCRLSVFSDQCSIFQTDLHGFLVPDFS